MSAPANSPPQQPAAKPAEQKPSTVAAQATPPTAAQPARQTPPSAFVLSTPSRAQRYLKVLVYGDFGTGKTTLAASADDVARMKDVLLIDAEAGDMSIADRPGITSVRIKDIKQFQALYDFLRRHCALRDQGNIEGMKTLEAQFNGGQPVTDPKQFRTVIIDSLTEVQKYVMYGLLGIKIGDQRLDQEPVQPQYQEWGRNAEIIRLLVRTFRDLPLNLIIVCSEQVVEDDRKQLNRRPALPGKLGNEVQGFLDIVGYLTAYPNDEGENVRRLYLQPGKTYQAKNRFPGLVSRFIENPVMADLIQLSDNAAGLGTKATK